jgi:hypothetical protein
LRRLGSGGHDVTATLRPIPTPYGGVKFRSRLEARWAIFFDRLHIPWEYEPQGFDIGDGEAYLPDFILGLGDIVWAEVKPSVWADPGGVARWEKFMCLQEPGTRGALLTSMSGNSAQCLLTLQVCPPSEDFIAGGHQCAHYEVAWSCCPAAYHFDLVNRGALTSCPQCSDTAKCSSCDGTGLHKGGPVACYCCDPPGSGQVPAATGAPWDDDKRIGEAYSAALSARFGTG